MRATNSSTSCAAGFGEDGARDGMSILFNHLLGAVMIETSRARGGSPASFERGLRYLVDGLTRYI